MGATDGRVELAKVDIDHSPQVAANFSVQSIPAVFALKNRQVVDSFIGAVPERNVQEFVDRLAPVETEADRLAAQGDEESLRRALEIDPRHADAATALAGRLVDRGQCPEALELLAGVPETPEVRRIAAQARVGGAAGDGSVETRLNGLLGRVKEDEGARREFIDLLEVLGADDPRTPRFRRALTSKLY